MDSCLKKFPGILLLAMTAGFPVMFGTAQARTPACCNPAPASCDNPSCAGGFEQALANGPDGTGGEPFAESPFDLGEGAPAQSGFSLAINSSPNMIGDLLSNGGYVDLFPFTERDTVSSIPIGGGDRRFKISENMSPLPRDRVFYAFNGFQQAARTVEGREIDVNRHTLGGEKTFWDATGSVEVRMPILQGLSALQSVDGDVYNDDRVEFGNMTIIPKFIINDGPSYVFSAGLGINLPTARDATVTEPGNFSTVPGSNQTLMNFRNQAVHLSPFLGLLLLPDDSTYVISYVQADFDTYGNTVTDGSGGYLGRYQDQNLLHFDVAVGRFLYRDYDTRLTGIAAQIELHYTTTMQDADQVSYFQQPIVTNPFNRLDLLVLTTGVNFQFWNTSWLTLGCAVPLRGAYQDRLTGINPERPFDAELQVLFNRYF
jgi:hypothetical protein